MRSPILPPPPPRHLALVVGPDNDFQALALSYLVYASYLSSSSLPALGATWGTLLDEFLIRIRGCEITGASIGKWD